MPLPFGTCSDDSVNDRRTRPLLLGYVCQAGFSS